MNELVYEINFKHEIDMNQNSLYIYQKQKSDPCEAALNVFTTE